MVPVNTTIHTHISWTAVSGEAEQLSDYQRITSLQTA